MEPLSKLAQARIDRDLTQAQVAESLDVDVATVCRWERGRSRPYPRHLKKLCDLFGKTAAELGLEAPEEVPSALPVALPDETQVGYPFAAFFQRDIELRLNCIVYDWLHSNKPLDARAVLQYRINQEFEDTTTMTNEPKRTHDGVDMGRREALYRLTLTPIYALGLDTVSKMPRWAPEDLLTHCAVGITACGQLAKGLYEDMVHASQVLSTYLPPLKEIVTHSSVHRVEAARLVAQALGIKATLAVHREGAKQAINFGRQAVIYAKESNNFPLQLSALRKLSWLYSCDNQGKRATESILKAQFLAEHAPGFLPSSLESAIAIEAARRHGENRRKEEAFLNLRQAHETFSASPDQIIFSDHGSDHSLALLFMGDGLVHYYLKQYAEALAAFAQAVDPETLLPRDIPGSERTSERVRVQIINHQALAALKQPQRDRELIIHFWKAGIQGAKALRSEQRLQEALTAYDIMEALWPDDQQITDLRDLIQHW